MTINDIKQKLIDPYTESLKKIFHIDSTEDLAPLIEVEQSIDYTNCFSTILFDESGTELLKRHLLRFFNTDLSDYQLSVDPAHISIGYYIINRTDPQDSDYKISLLNQKYLTLKLESLKSEIVLEFYPIIKYDNNWHRSNFFLYRNKTVREIIDFINYEVILSSHPDKTKVYQNLMDRLDKQQLMLSNHFKSILKENEIISEVEFSLALGINGLTVTIFLTDPQYTTEYDNHTYGWALRFTMITKNDQPDNKDLRVNLSSIFREFADSYTKGLSALFNVSHIDANLTPIVYYQQDNNKYYEGYITIADDHEVKSILNNRMLDFLNVKSSLQVERIRGLRLCLDASQMIDQDDTNILINVLEGLGFDYLIYPARKPDTNSNKIHTLNVSIDFQPILKYRDIWYNDGYRFTYDKKSTHLTFKPDLYSAMTALDKSSVKFPNDIVYYPELYQFISSMLESDYTELISYNIISGEESGRLLIYTAFILTDPDLIYRSRDIDVGWLMDINIENCDDDY
jgi:hypothetical protein